MIKSLAINIAGIHNYNYCATIIPFIYTYVLETLQILILGGQYFMPQRHPLHYPTTTHRILLDEIKPLLTTTSIIQNDIPFIGDHKEHVQTP